MSEIRTTAVLGAGVIGSSWSALFLANACAVRVYDPAPDSEKATRSYIEKVWPTLEELGLVVDGAKQDLSFHQSAADAVSGAGFVQENVPEKIEIKHALFTEIENHLLPEAIVASSASGLMVSEMQKGWKNPGRFLLGHPFNPPHLIPLVELIANDKTDPGVLEIAEQFYKQCGKVTIRVNKEVPGHVANRLQAALWREAIHLVDEGVASVADVDKAVWSGPGLRWAAMGPHMLFHLGAGEGGMSDFCKRYTPSFHRWWDDLGDTRITDDVATKLKSGVQSEADGRDVKQLCEDRDALMLAMLKHTSGLQR